MNGIQIHGSKPLKVNFHDYGGSASVDTAFKLCYPQASSIRLHGGSLTNQEEANSKFYCTPANNFGLDYLNVFATEDQTVLQINGQLMTTLNKGECWQTCFSEGLEVVANKPIYLGQFIQTHHAAPNQFETLGLSTHGLKESDFYHQIDFKTSDLRNGQNYYYANIICDIADTNSVLISGTVVNQSSWRPMGTSSKAWAKVQLDLGRYTFYSPSKLAVYYYALGFTGQTLPALGRLPNRLGSFKLSGFNFPEDSLKRSFGLLIDGKELIELIGTDTIEICPPDDLALITPRLGVSKWKIITSNGEVFSSSATLGQDTFNLDFSANNFLEINLTDTIGCLPSRNFYLRILSSPIQDPDYTVNYSCEGLSVVLENPSFSGQTNRWQYGRFFYEGNRVEITIPLTDQGSIVQLISERDGCAQELEVSIDLDGLNEITSQVPNILSPNGDGVNDQLCFADFFPYEWSSCFSIFISDRWGTPVYQSDNIARCWNPINIAPGVYYYVVNIGGSNFKGFIHIL